MFAPGPTGFAHDAVRVFKALSDPTRYQIVRMLLAQEEVGCQEFQRAFTLSGPALSHHFRVLENCGLMQSRKAGLHTFYRLNRNQLEIYLPEFAYVHGGEKYLGSISKDYHQGS